MCTLKPGSVVSAHVSDHWGELREVGDRFYCGKETGIPGDSPWSSTESNPRLFCAWEKSSMYIVVHYIVTNLSDLEVLLKKSILEIMINNCFIQSSVCRFPVLNKI